MARILGTFFCRHRIQLCGDNDSWSSHWPSIRPSSRESERLSKSSASGRVRQAETLFPFLTLNIHEYSSSDAVDSRFSMTFLRRSCKDFPHLGFDQFYTSQNLDWRESLWQFRAAEVFKYSRTW